MLCQDCRNGMIYCGECSDIEYDRYHTTRQIDSNISNVCDELIRLEIKLKEQFDQERKGYESNGNEDYKLQAVYYQDQLLNVKRAFDSLKGLY